MDLVRPLGLAGIDCAVVAEPNSQPLYSRFTRAALEWEGDFWDRTDQLVEALLRFGSTQPEPPVLLYQQDAQLLLISRNRERLAKVFRFVVPEATLVEDLVDKGRFQALAQREGLPVPKALLIDRAMGAAPIDLDLRFPVIIKPLTRRASWSAIGGSAKALQVGSLQELRQLWPPMVAAGLDLLVQEMVPGPESSIESYHVYVDQQGDIVADFTGRKIRTFPISCGHSTAVMTTAAADVAELGRDLVRRLYLRGVAKFDFKRGPDGRLLLFEINPRFNLWHHVGAVAGVNLPALVYADLAGLPRPATGPARAGVCWCQPLRDWYAAQASGITWPTWLRWALSCEAKSVSWDDPLPYVMPLLWRSALLQWLRKKAPPGPTWLRMGLGG
ncbi:MAG: ATP-grasp domain-containing protein [Kiloniellales bacterium]